MIIANFGMQFGTKEQFPYLLSIATIINGVFGNVFPVAAAAYSEQINDSRKVLSYSFPCRYGALAIPFIFKLPHFVSFISAITFALISLIIVLRKFKPAKIAN